MTDDDMEELRNMINNAVAVPSNHAYYNKCSSLSETRFKWAGTIHLDSMEGWFSLPESVRLDYVMWYVSTAAINNGMRWQDACNNLILIQHKLLEEDVGLTSIRYDPSTDDKNVLASISEHVDEVSSPVMLQLVYIIGSSGFDPSNKKAIDRLEDMGVLHALTIEDNAELDHYENELIAPRALFYAKAVFKMEDDSDELRGMAYILSNFMKLEDDDGVHEFAMFRNAVMKSKQLDLDGDCGYDWLINMANENRNHLIPIDDKNFKNSVNNWISRVESI